MPRYIRIPEEVVLYNPSNGRRLKRPTDRFEDGGGSCARCGELKNVILEEDPPYSMIRWLESFILNDSKLQVKTDDKNGKEAHTPEGSKTLKLFSSIRKAFRGKKVGDEVILDESYWERIKEIMEKPGNIWNMSQMSQFDAFFEAWNSASEESAATLAAEKTRKLEAVPTVLAEASAENTTST